MAAYGYSKDTFEIVSGSIFLFASGTLSNDTTAISASTPQIIAISCSSNINNRLTKLTTLNAYSVITLTSGSSNLNQDTKLVLRYVSSSDQADLIYSSSEATTDYLFGGINTNIEYINIPIQNNDDPFAIAYKTVKALTGSIGYNKFFSASLVGREGGVGSSEIEDDFIVGHYPGSTGLSNTSQSLGENMTVGTSFKIRAGGGIGDIVIEDGFTVGDYTVPGRFLIYSINSGSVAIPDFSGTKVQVGGMEIENTFKIGGSDPVFSYNIVQSGSGVLNQAFYSGAPITSSATLGVKLDPSDKTTTIFESNINNAGFKLNKEGNLESFIKRTDGASTGSEGILRSTRDNDDRLAAGDNIGSLRWITKPLNDDIDERVGGEAASIRAIAASADSSGITSHISISTATSTDAGSTEKLKIESDGTVHITGSLRVSGDIDSTTDSYDTIDGGSF